MTLKKILKWCLQKSISNMNKFDIATTIAAHLGI